MGEAPGKRKIYRPRHARTTGTFNPRRFDPVGDADYKLHVSREWLRFSKKFLEHNPECYVCGGKSEVTDHIEPSKGRKEVFERDLNFLAMCVVCHNTVTAKFDMKYKPGDDLKPKLEWLNSERARNQILSDRLFLKPKAMRYER